MRLFLFILAFSTAFNSRSQNRLFGVEAIPSSTAVTVKFGVTAGFTCDGYSVWHTSDSLFPLQQVGSNNGGPIGSMAGPEYYTFVHTTPAEYKANFYRVKIDFPYEESELIRVYYSPGGLSEMSFYPNPVSNKEVNVNLRFPSLKDTNLSGMLLTRFGTIRERVNIPVTQGHASLPVAGMDDGVYILWLTDGFNVFSGKFIVMP